MRVHAEPLSLKSVDRNPRPCRPRPQRPTSAHAASSARVSSASRSRSECVETIGSTSCPLNACSQTYECGLLYRPVAASLHAAVRPCGHRLQPVSEGRRLCAIPTRGLTLGSARGRHRRTLLAAMPALCGPLSVSVTHARSDAAASAAGSDRSDTWRQDRAMRGGRADHNATAHCDFGEVPEHMPWPFSC